MKVPFEKFISLKKNLKKGQKVKILSGSMTPFIYKDDIVVIEPGKVESLKPGDVIVFWRENKLICHLLVRNKFVEGKMLLETKGLSSGEYDEDVDPNMFLGVVTKPRLGFIKRIFFRFITIFDKKR